MNKITEILSNLRASLWFVPGLMILFSIALALTLIEVDSNIQSKWLFDYPRLFGLGADGARGMLTAIASSMLTVAALAFSLTLAAITQASGQFTPRIFRNFMRDRANQFALGYFVSVFAFCLIVLRTIRGADDVKFVPSLAVLSGLILAIGGVLVLIFFIHHIADSLQITTILNNITDETKRSVQKMFPREMGEAATEVEKNETWRADKTKKWRRITARDAGYVQDVDTDGLLDFATANRILIKMLRGVGQFAGSGAALAEIAPDSATPSWKSEIGGEKSDRISDEIGKFFTLGRHRTIEKDVGFGIRQIVDIALKALSPGVNDTTTAINCIDNLGEIVAEISRREMPAKVRSKDDVPRVITVAPDFQEYVETAFDQIRISGKANFAIFVRLITTISFIAECVTNETHLAALRRQIELIGEISEQTLATDYEKEKVRSRLRESREVFQV